MTPHLTKPLKREELERLRNLWNSRVLVCQIAEMQFRLTDGSLVRLTEHQIRSIVHTHLSKDSRVDIAERRRLLDAERAPNGLTFDQWVERYIEGPKEHGVEKLKPVVKKKHVTPKRK